MRVCNWKPDRNDERIMAASMDRLEAAAIVIAESAMRKAPTGSIYKKGGAKAWMSREPGSLKKSIRVVRLFNNKERNVRVYVGSPKVFYARFVEMGTKNAAAHPYLRPALHSSRAAIKKILRGAP